MHKTDKYGRPVIWHLMRQNRPNEMSEALLRDFCFYTILSAQKSMPKHIGEYVYVYDVKDLGKKNISMVLCKKLIPQLSINFPEICPMVCVINGGLFVQAGWKTVKPFLEKTTVNKFKFLSKKEFPEFFRSLIPKENLPACYGGDDTTFDALTVPVA